MELQDIQCRINVLMSIFVAQVKGATAMGNSDINHMCETVLIPILSEAFGYSRLENLNFTDQKNYPGIDLGDKDARVAFQITSMPGSEKIKETLQKFVRHRLYEKYDTLFIYILTEKQKFYSEKHFQNIIQGRFSFHTSKHILDYTDILGKAASLQVEKARILCRMLEDNVIRGDGVIDRSAEASFCQDSPASPYLFNQTPPEPFFVGRSPVRSNITEFYKDPDIHIAALKGFGGEGKSTIVRRWYDERHDYNIKPGRVFWWGFYGNSYLDQFVESLLRYLANREVRKQGDRNVWEQIELIKKLILQHECLFILDGFERIQEGKEAGDSFGRIRYREVFELLRFIADSDCRGLCILTSRYPVVDLQEWSDRSFRELEIDRLTEPEGRELFDAIGISGPEDDRKDIIEEYDGHALSLRLLAKHLVNDFDGDIRAAKNIPRLSSDAEAGGKAYRMLAWYDTQLSEDQRHFMRVFSLFPNDVSEKDFRGVFQSEMGASLNSRLKEMRYFSFMEMVNNLADRKLISKHGEGLYSTHPLIKDYFSSTLEDGVKKAGHQTIYEFLLSEIPKTSNTIEEMQPLFKMIYHGCAAGRYDQVFKDIYFQQINKGDQSYLMHYLGAYRTAYSLLLNFFPADSVTYMPLVIDKKDQSYILNELGVAAYNTHGLSKAKAIFEKKILANVENGQFSEASVGCQNLSETLIKGGMLEDAIKYGEKALEYAQYSSNLQEVIYSITYLAYGSLLNGKTEKAGELFKQAQGLLNEARERQKQNIVNSLLEMYYTEYLILIGNTGEALKKCNENIDKFAKYGWIKELGLFYLFLSSIRRSHCSYDEAQKCVDLARQCVTKTGVLYLEILSLLEAVQIQLQTGGNQELEPQLNHATRLCEQGQFHLYLPRIDFLFAKYSLLLKNRDLAIMRAIDAYSKAKGMGYQWVANDAANLLSETYAAEGDRTNAAAWSSAALNLCKEGSSDAS